MMASVMAQPRVQYKNGKVNLDDGHSGTEMAVDCPPSFVRAYPPSGGVTTSHLEPPPPTPAGGFGMKRNDTDKDLEAAAAVAATLPQPEMDLTRIRRMRESMKRKKELEKRDQRVRQDMAREDNAEKLRNMKVMTPEEEVAFRMKGVPNLGYEEDSSSVSDYEPLPEPTLSMEAVFAALHDISRETDDPSLLSELKFIENTMHNEDFQDSLELHELIKKKTTADSSCSPLNRDATVLVEDLNEDLAASKDNTARQLSSILSKHHVKGLLQSHDEVGEYAYVPPLHPNVRSTVVNPEDKVLLQNAAKYTTKPAKVVTINKGNSPLGATVRVEEDGNVMIGRLVVGGAAEKSGLLQEGDEILEVNGQTMRGQDVNQVGDVIGAMSGTLKFLIIPTDGNVTQNGGHVSIDMTKEPVMHIRALFDYDALDDMYLPCRELGLSFQKGDILHIMSQDDRDWWQAYREGDQDNLTLPGLIPAQEFQHQLEAIRISLERKEEEPELKNGLICGRTRKKKKKRKKKDVDSVSESGDEIEVYEEMALYHQSESKKRPIVLIALPNVGRHELRQRLVENDRDRFAFAVPHTTRSRLPHEIEHIDYHYASVREFEEMITSDEFLEHGSFQKNLYGTTIQAVQSVIDSGKICILNLHAESLKRLKATSLKPYIIFIAPPALERLRQNVSKEGKQMKEDELRKIIENARVIESKYAHYFDEIIRNTDLSRSYAELLRLINKLDTEPQWVPAAWLD